MRWLALIFLVMGLCFSVSAAEWTPFILDNGHVKIPVKVAGIDTYALLDSGAEVNAINKAFIKVHDLEFNSGENINLRGVFNTKTVTSVKNVPVELFSSTLELDNLSSVFLGHHSTGILLGAGFFSDFIVRIDYPNNRIQFLPRKSANLKKLKNIKMVRQKGSGKPIVKISINKEKSFWVLLDTGNAGGVFIDRFFAESLGLTEQPFEKSIAKGINSSRLTESVTVDELKFGPYTLKNVLVRIPAKGQVANLGRLANKRPAESNRFGVLPTGTLLTAQRKRQRGILGYDVLKHFVLTLDYKNGHAHVGLPEDDLRL